MELHIAKLADRHDLLPLVGRWHWEEWGHFDPGGSLEGWTARLAEDPGATLVALVDGQPVGSVGLSDHDMPDREDLADLTPWLGGLFVLPEHRDRGVASALVHRCEDEARARGFERLYLYTGRARGLYEGLDWEPIGEDVYQGQPVTIMARRLREAEPDRQSEEAAWLASLRPSRVREVQAGATAWTSVDLVAWDCGSQGPELRAVLEAYRIKVNLFPAGQARHVVRVLDGTEASAPYVILACHGDEGRILLPGLAPQVERFQPFHSSLGPADVRSFVNLPGRTVICTGCDTGTQELADAFLAGGCDAYVAPAGAPWAHANVMVVALLFYELVHHRSIAGAMAKLAGLDDELAMWRLFQRPV